MRVFLPLDGSEKDERAVQVADAFASLVRGAIHIVRVVETHPSIEQHLRELAETLSSAGRRAVTWEVIQGADVAKELLHRAEQSADVIVMATRAPGTVARAFYGSVADEIVRKASRPVVVVPPGARYGQGNRIEIRRVLVPLDGSQAARTAIERLRELVTTATLEYVFVQAVHRENTGGYMMPEPVAPQTAGDVASDGSNGSPVLHVQAELAERHLQGVAEELRRHGDTATIRVVEYGDPASAIVEAIRAELVDLIAMSTHGAGGVRRVLQGSVANRVARESEVPVFLVTPPSSRES